MHTAWHRCLDAGHAVSVPSVFATLCTHCPARSLLRRLAALALALAGLLASGTAQAAAYSFNGGPVANCPLVDKTYTCASTTWLRDNDELVIGSGHTLAFGTDLTLTYNQGLSMVAGARLVVAGSLNIRAIKPANLQVDGGSIEVAGSFSMGDQKQTLSADVSADAMHLGSDRITIKGNLNARTSIAIGSYASIEGDISAAVVTAASPVTIDGDVKATQSFRLASGGKVLGNVDTGRLVLEASGALVRGSAWVDTALLEWHGRVGGTIYCKQGGAGASCDCVTNNSGYAVNSANGPRCEGPAAPGVHHYRITHDGQASSCAGEEVTVTACANADCTAPHVASAPGVTLVPGGAAVSFGSSGVAQASVTSIQSGSMNLGFMENVPVTCRHTGTGSASCAMNFSDRTAFEISAPSHRAGELQAPTLQALKPAANRKSCDPVFKDRTVKVDFSCAHVKPASGRDYLHLGAKGSLTETASAPLACSGMAAGAVPTTRQVDVSFDAEGKGSVDLRYPDVGVVRLIASVTRDGARIEGEGEFTAVPHRFGLAVTAPAGGFVAGVPFELKLASLNKAGGVTRGFDKDLLPDLPGVALGSCAIAPLRPGSVDPAAAGFTEGAATLELSWSEVGSMGLNASLADFLGSGISSSGSSGDCKSLGPFVPAYLQVERDVASPARSFDYSGEPIHVVVSARNRQSEITRNYEHATGRSEDVTLAAVVSAGGPGAWAGTPAAIPAASFTEGKAAWSRAWVVGKDVRPASIAIRATSATATSQDKGENLKTEVRLGRLRLGSRFGGHKAILSMPVTAEYWTGKSWLLNSDDNHTVVPQAAFAFKGSAAGMKPAPAFGAGPLKLTGGAAAFGLALGEGGPGPVDIAINLRSGTQDDACIGDSAGTGVATSGAAIPWLRPFTTGCNAAQPRDPYGRATFGVYTPENRRIIHVREVFN